MSQQHVAIVKCLFAAVRRRDLAGVREAYHPEVVIHESSSLPYGGDYHEQEEAIEMLNGYYRTWDPLRPGVGQPSTPIFLETTADSVVVLWQEEAVAPGSGNLKTISTTTSHQQGDSAWSTSEHATAESCNGRCPCGWQLCA